MPGRSRAKSIFQGHSCRFAACAPVLRTAGKGYISQLTQPLAAPPREIRVAERHGLGYGYSAPSGAGSTRTSADSISLSTLHLSETGNTATQLIRTNFFCFFLSIYQCFYQRSSVVSFCSLPKNNNEPRPACECQWCSNGIRRRKHKRDRKDTESLRSPANA